MSTEAQPRMYNPKLDWWRVFVLEPARERYREKFVVEPAIARAREVEAKTRRYLDRIHPAGAEIIHWWLAEMHHVALEGDRAEVERLADNIQRKLSLERLWGLQKRISVKPSHPRRTHWLRGLLAKYGLSDG